MKWFLSLVLVLFLSSIAQAQCAGGVCRVPKVVKAPVKLVSAVKPVRRITVLPKRILKVRCR